MSTDYAGNDSQQAPALTGWIGGAPEVTGVPVTGYVWNHATPDMVVLVTVYKMRGMDKNTNGLYDTWLVSGTPDLTGASYAGALAKPLRDIIVIDSWS